MKILQFIVLLVILVGVNAQAQSFKETKIKNGETSKTVLAKFVYEGDLITSLEIKNPNGNTFMGLANISEVVVKNKRYYVREVNDVKTLLTTIKEGNVSIYKGRSDYYINNEEYGTRKLRKDNSSSQGAFMPQMLYTYISKCQAAVNKLYSYSDIITLKKLHTIVDMNNSCDLQDEAQIADIVYENLDKPSDTFDFGVTLGVSNYTADFSSFLDEKDTHTSFTYGAKLILRPNFANQSINFTTSIDYIKTTFYDEFASKGFSMESSVLSTMFGVNYQFNNIHDSFQPYIGINAGFLWNLSSDAFLRSTTVVGSPSTAFESEIELGYNFNIGTYFEVFKQKFDFSIVYQPTLEMDLEEKLEIVENHETYDLSGFSLRITYLFL